MVVTFRDEKTGPGSSKTSRGRGAIFAEQPPIFILPSHLTLNQLHDAETRLVDHGGRLTYDIAEAKLILGQITHKKRAALELRSRGISLEEISTTPALISSAPSADPEMPCKRRKVETSTSSNNTEIDVVDLSTVSNDEVKADMICILKLEWLDHSIQAGHAMDSTAYTVLKGRRTSPAQGIPHADSPSHQLPSQILERAKKDAASRTSPAASNHFHPRRSKESLEGASSQRHPPALLHQTTSEHDEPYLLPPQPDWVRNQVLYACLRSAPLHPPNEDFMSQLEKIRRIRLLTLDEIGVRAYSTSIAAIAAYPYFIRRPTEVLNLPGCDMKIAHLFAEFQRHGRCNHTDDDGNVAAADALDTDPVLRVLNSFYQIWGVGAKTAREFYYHRGWRDLDDIVEHGWDSLSRVQQIGVKFYEEFQEGLSRAESETIADIVGRHARRVRPGADADLQCILVGGYRRGKQLSGDVDLILTHRDEAVTRNLVVDVVASLEKEHYITHTLALHLTSTLREQQTLPYRGEETGQQFDTLDKALVVWQDPHFSDSEGTDHSDPGRRKRNPNPHRRVDIIISPWRTVGCAVLGWSGDTTFQRDLRRYAKNTRQWKFDSSGVRERNVGGRVIDLEGDGKTWEERERLVMEGLGVGWRPAEERCTR